MRVRTYINRLLRRYPGCVILSDCCNDTNGVARLASRWQGLTGNLPLPLPVATTREAGLTLLDMLIAGTTAIGRRPKPGIIVINKATRGNDWPNGVPFGWLWHQGNLIVTTLDAETLALVQQHLKITLINATDIATVVAASDAWCSRPLTNIEKAMLRDTQFRSLWYQLLLAAWVWDRRNVPREEYILAPRPDTPEVLCSDDFGNLKTNGDPAKLGLVDGQQAALVLPDGECINLTYYDQLAKVPVGDLALVKGSSGFGFLELMVQKGSARKKLQGRLRVGEAFSIQA